MTEGLDDRRDWIVTPEELKNGDFHTLDDVDVDDD